MLGLRSLRAKLLALSVGISLILGLILGVTWLYFQVDTAITEADFHNTSILNSITGIMIDEYKEEDATDLYVSTHVGRAYFPDKTLIFAEITTPDGRVVSSKDPKRVGKRAKHIQEIRDVVRAKKPKTEFLILSRAGDVFSGTTVVDQISPFNTRPIAQEFTAPIIIDGKVRLVLHMYYSMDRLLVVLNRLEYIASLIILNTTLFGAVISFFLLDRIVYRPIMRLEKVAEEIASGEVSRRVEIVGYDEFSELGNRFNEMADSLVHARFEADTDSLTGLYNYRHMQGYLESQINLAGRYQREVTIAMFDIDHFKNVNDLYGHQTGDTVLAMAAEYVLSELREVDYMARYGGEEFVVILPETSAREAIQVMERIREGFPKNVYIECMGVRNPVYISIGIADFPLCAQDATTLLSASDTAMLLAKRKGRNQISYFRTIDKKAG